MLIMFRMGPQAYKNPLLVRWTRGAGRKDLHLNPYGCELRMSDWVDIANCKYVLHFEVRTHIMLEEES